MKWAWAVWWNIARVSRRAETLPCPWLLFTCHHAAGGPQPSFLLTVQVVWFPSTEPMHPPKPGHLLAQVPDEPVWPLHLQMPPQSHCLENFRHLQGCPHPQHHANPRNDKHSRAKLPSPPAHGDTAGPRPSTWDTGRRKRAEQWAECE